MMMRIDGNCLEFSENSGLPPPYMGPYASMTSLLVDVIKLTQ